MRKLSVACGLALAIEFVASIVFAMKQSAVTQLFGMAALGIVFFLTFVSLVIGFTSFAKKRFRAFIPAAICIVALPISLVISGRVGYAIQMWQFRRDFPRYTEIVQLIKSGNLKPMQGVTFELPEGYQDLAWRTMIITNNNDVMIEFWTGGGYPLKHSGYMYVSSGSIENDTNTLQRWPLHFRINTNWFRICD